MCGQKTPELITKHPHCVHAKTDTFLMKTLGLLCSLAEDEHTNLSRDHVLLEFLLGHISDWL